MTELLDDSLAAGREAAERHAWREAYEHLHGVGMTALGAEDLQSLADAAWWTGKLDEALEARQRAFAKYVQAGEPRRAAPLALMLAIDNQMFGNFDVAKGWLANGESSLRDEEEGPEHAFLAFVQGLDAYWSGDNDAAMDRFAAAYDLAGRFGDRNGRSMARVFMGSLAVRSGDVDAGLRMLDEATATALSGALQPLATGLIYCVTIDSCQALGDCGRAMQWTTAANRWCEGLDVSGFPGLCRVHRAEVMRLKGEWPAAEKQAQEACDELGDYNRFVTGEGYYEIGEIRRRRGDFADAEEAYEKAVDNGRDPQPGRALLRLAQGRAPDAAAAIKRDLAQESLGPLDRAKRLPAQVEISLKIGEVQAARDAAEELGAIADQYTVGGKRTPALDGAAQLAWGQIKLEEGDWEGAAKALRAARAVWEKVGAPYEIAQARMLIGRAYRAEGDEDGAREEFSAAARKFEQLGAVLDQQQAVELRGGPASRTTRTFMFTDIVDSTKQTRGEEWQEGWEKLLSWHDRTLSGLIERSGGQVIKHTGDGYFAAFQSAESGVDAATAIQRALDEHDSSLDVRIGLHTGGALHRANGDYAGQGVHMAARIGALACGGEILISRESLENGAGRMRVSETRSEQLRGFDQPVELVAVEWR